MMKKETLRIYDKENFKACLFLLSAYIVAKF